MPLIQKFLKFWDETILEDNQKYAELEIEEISHLFRYWLHNNSTINTNANNKRKEKYLLKESRLLDILVYFHPELEIGEQKYVYHVRNLLWDKDMDIENALNHMDVQSEWDSYNEVGSSSALDEIYSQYCNFYTNQANEHKSLLVSKSYFIKYLESR